MEATIEPIYIVDDEKSICDSLSGVFSDEGYTVITCKDAATFFEKAAQTPPSLVFLDVWLPGIDGLDVLMLIQKKYPATPVIMMSGHVGINAAVNAIKKGAYDFIEKPIDIDILVKKISIVLKKNEQDSRITHFQIPTEKAAHHSEDNASISLVPSNQPQRTLARDIVLNGTGLLSGRKTGIIISPADENQGIVFKSLSGQYIPSHVTSLENYLPDPEDNNFTANLQCSLRRIHISGL